jgi:outer membrane protein
MIRKANINFIKLIFLHLIVLHIKVIYAEDISQYLEKAYSVSPILKIKQMEFKNIAEQYPSAISGFLPSVSYNISNQGADQKIPTSDFNQSTGLNIDIPVFNGGASVAGLRIAENQYYKARLDWYIEEQKFLLESIKTYLSYYEAIKIYNISGTSVEATKKSLESTEIKLKLGEATKTDLASAQSSYAQALSQQSIAMSKLISAQSDFIITFGEDNENIQLPDFPQINILDVKELQEKILLNNFDLNKAKYDLNLSKLNVLSKASQLAPVVSAKLNVNNDRGRSYKAYLSVDIPIFNSSRGNPYSDTRVAKNKLRAASYQLSDSNKKARDMSNILWVQLDSYKSQVQYTEDASEAAKLVYESTVREESVGNKTILDVLESQAKWYNAQITHVGAQKSYLLSAYNIKQQIGELTAKSLKLNCEIFEPEKEFKKTKMKIVGF